MRKIGRNGQVYLNTPEALVAQLQSSNVLAKPVPGYEVTWGTILGNITEQTDLVQLIKDMLDEQACQDCPVDLTKYALKTDLETLATKEQITTLEAALDAITIPTKVSELANDADYAKKADVDAQIATNKAELDALKEKAVQYKDFNFNEQDRKTIELANYDSISGVDTKGTGHNLLMLSKWDVTDIGAPANHANINTKDNVTINDDLVIATTNDIEEANKDNVKYQNFTFNGETRKTIQLDNYNSLSGIGTNCLEGQPSGYAGGEDLSNQGFNLAMVSKWNVADFGSPSLHFNINTKDVVTVNDDKIVLTDALLENVLIAQDGITIEKQLTTDPATQKQFYQYVVKAPAIATLQQTIADLTARIEALENK